MFLWINLNNIITAILYVTHENISCVRTYVTYKMCNVRTYLHTNVTLFSVRTNGKYENVYNVRTYVSHEYEMFSVRTYVTYENII